MSKGSVLKKQFCLKENGSRLQPIFHSPLHAMLHLPSAHPKCTKLQARQVGSGFGEKTSLQCVICCVNRATVVSVVCLPGSHRFRHLLLWPASFGKAMHTCPLPMHPSPCTPIRPLNDRLCPKAEWAGPLLPRADPKAQGNVSGRGPFSLTIWVGHAT